MFKSVTTLGLALGLAFGTVAMVGCFGPKAPEIPQTENAADPSASEETSSLSDDEATKELTGGSGAAATFE